MMWSLEVVGYTLPYLTFFRSTSNEACSPVKSNNFCQNGVRTGNSGMKGVKIYVDVDFRTKNAAAR